MELLNENIYINSTYIQIVAPLLALMLIFLIIAFIRGKEKS